MRQPVCLPEFHSHLVFPHWGLPCHLLPLDENKTPVKSGFRRLCTNGFNDRFELNAATTISYKQKKSGLTIVSLTPFIINKKLSDDGFLNEVHKNTCDVADKSNPGNVFHVPAKRDALQAHGNDTGC